MQGSRFEKRRRRLIADAIALGLGVFCFLVIYIFAPDMDVTNAVGDWFKGLFPKYHK